MESKNLTKSFGVRLPLDLYMQMLKVSTENKITMTDLCLYSIMNSGIPNGELNFKKGGEVDEKYTAEIRRLNAELSRMQRSFNNLLQVKENENEVLKKDIKKILLISLGVIEFEASEKHKNYALDSLKELAEKYKVYNEETE